MWAQDPDAHERLWTVDVLLNTMRRLWPNLTHFHWDFTFATPSTPRMYQAALRDLLEASRLRSLALFFEESGDGPHLPLLDALPTSLVDLEIGPFQTKTGWTRLRENVRRLPNLRFLHVSVVTEDDVPDISPTDDDTLDPIGNYDRAQLNFIIHDRPDLEVTYHHESCGFRHGDFS